MNSSITSLNKHRVANAYSRTSGIISWMGRTIFQLTICLPVENRINCINYFCSISKYEMKLAGVIAPTICADYPPSKIELRPELCDKNIRQAIFKQLQSSFENPSYYVEMQKASLINFQELIVDLDKMRRCIDNSINIENRVFNRIKALYSELKNVKSVEYSKISEYVEICFRGEILANIPSEAEQKNKHCRAISIRLIKDFMTIVMNDKIEIKSRLAAYSLLEHLNNSFLTKKYKDLAERNTIFKHKVRTLYGPIPIEMKKDGTQD